MFSQSLSATGTPLVTLILLGVLQLTPLYSLLVVAAWWPLFSFVMQALSVDFVWLCASHVVGVAYALN